MSTVSDGLFQYGGMPVGGAIGASPFGNAWFVSYSRGRDVTGRGRSPKAAVRARTGVRAAGVSARRLSAKPRVQDPVAASRGNRVDRPE